MTTLGRRSTATAFLVILFAFLTAREIDRPFHGLHSWDSAIAAWSARAHVQYGLGYTRGVATLAVGNPPPEAPPWYLDHPQLHPLLDAAAMAILGPTEASLRLAALAVTALSLPILIALLRRLYDDETAVLATLFYVIFPITPFFNAACWTYWLFPFVLLAYWCYLSHLGELGEPAQPGSRHLLGLGVALFILPQLYWVGFFYAATIGSHYLARCFTRRQAPDRRLLATLTVSPLAAAAVDFAVLLYGRGGDYQSLLRLYQFRAQMADGAGRTILGWFMRQWELLKENFTLPIVILVGAYLAYRVADRIRARRSKPDGDESLISEHRRFAHPWLFVGPGLMTMVVFTEWFWVHNFVYMWLSLPVAVAAALGVLQLMDVLLSRSRRLAMTALLSILAVIGVSAASGIDHYYAIRWRSPAEIEMFKKLNMKMAPDQVLLTYRNYLIQDHADKLVHYRPEVAWYLDRQTVVARTLSEVEKRAEAGGAPFYLVDTGLAPPKLIEDLKARYPSELVQGHPYRREPHEKTGLADQLVFDLRHDNQVSTATASANKALRLRKALYEELSRKADALLFEGMPAEAVEAYRDALAVLPADSGSARIYNNLGWALQALGRLDEAIEAYTSAVELDPTFVRAQNNLIAARRARGR